MKAESFLPDDYRPAEDEPFMNDRQLEYFRRKLVVWKQELMDQSAETVEALQDSGRNVPDIAGPRLRGNRPRARTAHPRPAAQACLQDRRRPPPHRKQRIRLLRGLGRADQPQAARRPPDRHDDARGAGKARTPRARAPRGMTGTGPQTSTAPRLLNGRCRCGDVRYRVADAFAYAANCHCLRLPPRNGIRLQALRGIPARQFAVVAGADRLMIVGEPLSHDARCAGCGALLYSLVRDGALGTLTDDPTLRPSMHIHVGSKAAWETITDAPSAIRRAPRLTCNPDADRPARHHPRRGHRGPRRRPRTGAPGGRGDGARTGRGPGRHRCRHPDLAQRGRRAARPSASGPRLTPRAAPPGAARLIDGPTGRPVLDLDLAGRDFHLLHRADLVALLRDGAPRRRRRPPPRPEDHRRHPRWPPPRARDRHRQPPAPPPF